MTDGSRDAGIENRASGSKPEARMPNPERSELRQDPVTGTWVVIAQGRARRPQEAARLRAPATALPPYRDTCPFCNFARFRQARETLFLPNRKHWVVRAFPNKYPVFTPADQVTARKVGLYTAMDAVGFHEVITPRAHNAMLASMRRADLVLYLRAWRERYRALMPRPSVAYIQLIENHGRESGGSVEHPHVQLLAAPVLPSGEILDLLRGAERYFAENGSCAYCDIRAADDAAGTRSVFTNERFSVFCPFAPRVPAEQWVVPLRHAAGFEALADDELPLLAEALQEAAGRLFRGFRDPAYNLSVYSAPCDTTGYVCAVDEFAHFHWHIRILPRSLNLWGGFEVATGLEITPMAPEAAAAYLRSV